MGFITFGCIENGKVSEYNRALPVVVDRKVWSLIYMRFKRINQDTIRCIITEEDMLEHGVDVEDFLRNRGNAREFLHEIVEKAAQEVGYEMQSGMLSMQVMPLPSNALAVTFSEQNETSLSSLIENIKNALGGLESISAQEKLEELKDVSDEERAEVLEQFMQDIFGSVMEEESESEAGTTHKADKAEKTETETSQIQPFFIIRFANISLAEDYCKALPTERAIKSSVYKKEDGYYLLLYRGRMSKNLFEEMAYMAIEYGTLLGADTLLKSYMTEHMQCIIKKSAVKVLRNL